MFKKTRVASAALAAVTSTCSVGTVLMLAGAAAQAQTQPQAQGSSNRIEITGSLIRRIDGEAALPVVTLRADDLARAGVTNAEGVVKFITQQQGGTVTSASVSGTNGAAAYADLRSLGAGRTLVLLNGKRVVSNPFSSVAVDLNTLPISAIERVETLPDGASATYGTDAIAGVINFITRKDYRGITLSAQAQVPQDDGGEIYTASILGGFGDLSSQGFNILAGFNYRDQKPMLGTARDFMKSSYIPERGFNGTSPTTFPANYSQSVNGVTTIANTNPSLPNGCLPPSSLAIPEANNTVIRCFADTQLFTNVIPEQEQSAFFTKGTLALGTNHSATLEYFRSNNRVRSQIAPSPEGGLTMTPASPFYPGRGINPITNPALNPAQNISVAWRTTVLGARSGEQDNTTQRAVAGLEGTLMNWDYQAALLWSNSKVENSFINGYPRTIPLRNGVQGLSGAPFLNPFGEQTAAGLAYLQENQVIGKVQDGEGTLQSLTASASRSFGALPGGPIGFAVATEFRKEEMVYNTDITKVSQAASSGLAGSGATREGDRDVSALSLELSLPVTRSLELGASVRLDNYSDFGNSTNPKLSLRYKASDAVLIRGSANTGFSAPTLTALYAPNATTFTANRYNDPLLCPGGVPALSAGAVPARDCGLQFQRLTGGNTQLEPEESTAWTVGLVLQPLSNVTVGFDYWNYKIKKSVSTIGEQSVFADPVKYAGLYIRCSQAPAERRLLLGACQNPGNADPLAYILDTNQNLGDVITDGVDLQFNWNIGATPYGRFNATVRSTYVLKYKFQVEPQGVYFSPLSFYSPQFAGPVLRYQQVTMLNWDTDIASVLVSNRYNTGYTDQNAQGAPFNREPFNTNRVKSYSLWDVSASYRGFKGLTLSAGVLNVLNTDPPFTNQVGRFQARGYDDRFHNPLGRTYQVSARYEY